RAARGERAGAGKVDILFRLGQRLLLVLLDELGGGIDVALGAVHAAKVRPRRGSGHPARTGAYAQRGGLARAPAPSRGHDPMRSRLAPFGLPACPLSDGGFCRDEIDFKSILIARLPRLKDVKYLFTVCKAV